MSALDNPVVTTWKYTIRINDTVDPQDVMQLPKALVDQSRVQFSHWHLEKWSSLSQPFVRGILRCIKPTSYKMVTAMLPDANFKPLRGVFTVNRVNAELKPLYRVGDVYSIGSIISNKRSADEVCSMCGHVSKKAKPSTPPSEPLSPSQSQSDEDSVASSALKQFLQAVKPANSAVVQLPSDLTLE